MSKRHSLAVSPKHHALVLKHAEKHGMKISRATEELLAIGFALFNEQPAKPARSAR